MTRLPVAFVLILLACGPRERDSARDAEEVPIGPGSDSTALLPPDTPVSRLQPGVPADSAGPGTTR